MRRRTLDRTRAGASRHIPERFFPVGGLGSSYTGRAVLFHHVSSRESEFTAGLNVTIDREEFERQLSFLAKHYEFVDLDQWLEALAAGSRARRPALLTFDDAYASVFRVAAPICRARAIPALFFVNAGLVDNRHLALDNLVCYAVNRKGMETVERAAGRRFRSFPEVFRVFLPTLSLTERRGFEARLAELLRVDPAALAREGDLYIQSEELRALPDMDFEVGSHTTTHVHLRELSEAECEREIVGNKHRLDAIVQRRIRAFSYPYGSRPDATTRALDVIERSGHDVAFLVGAQPNTPDTDRYLLKRVSLKGGGEAVTFMRVEVLPRLRALRDAFLPRRT